MVLILAARISSRSARQCFSAVHAQHATGGVDLAEADAVAPGVHHVRAATQLDPQLVEVRRLSRPRRGLLHRESELAVATVVSVHHRRRVASALHLGSIGARQ